MESAKAISWQEGGKCQKYQDEGTNNRRHRNGGIVGISNKCKNQSAVPAMECGMGVRLAILGVWRGVHHSCTGCHWCDGLDGALALWKLKVCGSPPVRTIVPGTLPMRGQPPDANGCRCIVDSRAQLAQCCWLAWNWKPPEGQQGQSKGTTGRARVTGTEKEKGKAGGRTNNREGQGIKAPKGREVRTFSFAGRNLESNREGFAA